MVLAEEETPLGRAYSKIHDYVEEEGTLGPEELADLKQFITENASEWGLDEKETDFLIERSGVIYGGQESV